MPKKEKRFRLLFENAPMPYQSLDEYGYFLDVNNRWLETLGYDDKKEVIGKWCGDILTPEFQKLFEKRFPIFKHVCMIDGVEFDMVRKDGSIIKVSVTGRIQHDDNGNFICTHCIFQDITEAQKTTKALKESEKRYRRLSDATFESIFISEKGVCIEQNSAAELMFGYTQEEAVGLNLTEWISPEDRPTVLKHILSGDESPYEVTALRKDGTTFPCEIQGRQATIEDKAIRFTALRDITNRKKAEEELRDSEERHRLIFEHSPLGIIRFNKEGRIIDCNNKFTELMGANKDVILGFNSLKNGPAKMSETLKKALNGCTSHYEDAYTSVTGGKTSYIKALFNPVDPEKIPTEVIATIEDITDRKVVEGRLAASEERFRLMAENAKDVIYRFSLADEKYEYISSACQKVMGYEPEDFYADYTLMIKIVNEPWQSMLSENWPNLMKGEVAPVVEYKITHKSGEIKWMQQTNILLTDSSGKAIAIEGIIRDITDLKSALEKVELEKARAESASNTKSEFLANMSHEIRTPLNGIMGMLQLLQADNLSQKQVEYITAAMQASKRLNNVLSDILDLARVEAGKLSIQNTEFNPLKTMQHIYDMFRVTAQHSGLELNLEIALGVPEKIIGDDLRLQQILSNLVGNALKFTEKGSVTISAQKIQISRPDKTSILFIVSDTGAGIPDEQLNKLFESFTQASEGYTREHQGVGLGLAICKQLVTLMNGSISIESHMGIGSSFYVSIPFTNSPAASISDEKKELPEKTLPLSGCKILVAEDERINRLYTKRYLESMGCYVETAENGQQTLNILSYKDFDLVLMDVQMPVMNGVEATEAIRKGEAGAHNKRIPIVAITAYAMENDKNNFKQSGMDDYIAKPVEQEELHRVISLNVLNKRK